MSGKPYPEGVSKVLAALARLESLTTLIDELQPKANEIHVQLRAAMDERKTLAASISPLLMSMDVESPDNFGFGGRLGWFLAEMRRQLIAEIKR